MLVRRVIKKVVHIIQYKRRKHYEKRIQKVFGSDIDSSNDGSSACRVRRKFIGFIIRKIRFYKRGRD